MVWGKKTRFVQRVNPTSLFGISRIDIISKALVRELCEVKK